MGNKYKKRADGRYMTQISIGTDPKTGKLIRKTLYAKTIAELKSKEIQVRSDLKRGLDVHNSGKLTLLEYAWKWYDLNTPGKSHSSIDRYNRLIRLHLNLIGHLKLQEVTQSDIMLQLNSLGELHETKRCLLLLLKQIFRSAIGDRLLIYDPTAYVKLPNIVRTEKEPLSEFEVQCLEEADLDDSERCFVNILYYTGMRKGEVLALSKRDIDFKKKTIYVWSAVEYRGNTPNLKNMPKTEAGVRFIPIPADLLLPLKDYVKKLPPGGLLFSDKDGKLLKKSAARSLWDRIYRKASDVAGCERSISPSKKVIYINDPLKGLTPHRFRHNYATMLYYAGVDVKEASKILGHADVATTLRIYTHLIENQKLTSADKLNMYLANAK
ncbi:MAG: site-specific integrase [Lachnospiraceae bacterium]|nr:site-specific integrase [Lachnospiraceae bacterium]